jgi:hypothetical protein
MYLGKNSNVQVGRLIVKILHYMCQTMYCLGDIMLRNLFFPPPYYYLFFKHAHIYLSHLKFNYNFSFAPYLDTLKEMF